MEKRLEQPQSERSDQNDQSDLGWTVRAGASPSLLLSLSGHTRKVNVVLGGCALATSLHRACCSWETQQGRAEQSMAKRSGPDQINAPGQAGHSDALFAACPTRCCIAWCLNRIVIIIIMQATANGRGSQGKEHKLQAARTGKYGTAPSHNRPHSLAPAPAPAPQELVLVLVLLHLHLHLPLPLPFVAEPPGAASSLRCCCCFFFFLYFCSLSWQILNATTIANIVAADTGVPQPSSSTLLLGFVGS